tara:strand:+ start:1750 stop:2913 length:1164 start_codon:yes stop_codon:yes gene_type:complete
MVKFLMIKRYNFVLIFFFFSLVSAQENKNKISTSINGYVAYLPSLINTEESTDLSHLFHNRINLKGYYNEKFSFGLGIRNRIFSGKNSNINPDLGVTDLSFFLINNNDFKIHSIIDRLWVKYSLENIELSIGRQRVNWGINQIWNSNDLFNAYNFMDFDYIERPGSDVFRFQYFGDNLSTLDIVYKPKSFNESILAGLYKINKLGYDIQFLLAKYNDELVFGGGWAGNIKNAGFKGEVSLFYPNKESLIKKNSTSFSSSIDYSFTNGLYVLFTYLYNSNGFVNSKNLNLFSISESRLSPKNLMPSKNSFLTQFSGQLTPAINSSISFIYGQGINFLYMSPTISYDLNQNLDLELISQFFYRDIPLNDEENEFKNLLEGIYLRFKYSF